MTSSLPSGPPAPTDSFDLWSMIDCPLGLRLGRSAVPCGGGAWGVLLVLVWVLGGANPAQAQTRAADTLNLIDRYRTARVQALARQALRHGWTARALPPDSVPVARPRVLRRPDEEESAQDSDPAPRFPIDDVRTVHPLERGWFSAKYEATDWSFLGASTNLTFFDTTYTRDLRARLQAQFGDPTQTLADLPDTSRIGEAQFEYWFVVNDSIPVRVSDVNGPNERGVIVSTSRGYRQDLVPLREALLHPLRDAERAPFVDYYYEEETRRWYRVGYDGSQFFRERISRFDIVSGRRPDLDTTQTSSPTAPDSTDSAPSLP